MNIFNLERAFKKRRERGNPYLFVAVDLHETIIEGKYNRMNEGAAFYPGALEVLRQWTKRPDIKLILWTSSHSDAIADILYRLFSHGVTFDHVNCNPDCPSTDLCDLSSKWYFDVLIEDKASFEGATDWALIKAELIRIGEWTP
jgi:hypothetical protein